MLKSLSLNRRHSTALFLALLTVGAFLIFDGSAKQAAGLALIGIAFAWAFGSSSRLVHWTFTISGLALILAPICYEWYDQRQAIKGYESRVAAFERDLPQLTNEFPLVSVGAPIPPGATIGRTQSQPVDWFARHAPKQQSQKPTNPGTVIRLQDGTTLDFKGDLTKEAKQAVAEHRNSPLWMQKAVQAGVDLDAVPDWRKPARIPPEAFSVVNALVSRWMVTLPGFVLLCVGIGLIVGIRTRPQP